MNLENISGKNPSEDRPGLWLIYAAGMAASLMGLRNFHVIANWIGSEPYEVPPLRSVGALVIRTGSIDGLAFGENMRARPQREEEHMRAWLTALCIICCATSVEAQIIKIIPLGWSATIRENEPLLSDLHVTPQSPNSFADALARNIEGFARYGDHSAIVIGSGSWHGFSAYVGKMPQLNMPYVGRYHEPLYHGYMVGVGWEAKF